MEDFWASDDFPFRFYFFGDILVAKMLVTKGCFSAKLWAFQRFQDETTISLSQWTLK